MENLISIREASKILNISLQTLRRWDQTGKLTSIRAGEKGHRYYKQSDLELFTNNLFTIAKQWSNSEKGYEPNSEYYCSNSSIFQFQLNKLNNQLSSTESLKDIYPIIVAISGEIGNNSFDHNLGNWPDIPGIFFAYDLTKKIIVLADRGKGILASLIRVRPNLKSHEEALKLAFTEKITGRAPESRGNGLKFVRKAISMYPISLNFQTGDANLSMAQKRHDIALEKAETNLRGCLALIKF